LEQDPRQGGCTACRLSPILRVQFRGSAIEGPGVQVRTTYWVPCLLAAVQVLIGLAQTHTHCSIGFTVVTAVMESGTVALELPSDDEGIDLNTCLPPDIVDETLDLASARSAAPPRLKPKVKKNTKTTPMLENAVEKKKKTRETTAGKRPSAAVIKKRPAANKESSPMTTTAGKRPSAAVIKKRPAANKESSPMTVMLDSIPGELNMPMWLSTTVDTFKDSVTPAPINDDFMEIFSMPRVVTAVRKLGMNAIRSMDKETGWDLSVNYIIQNAFKEVALRQPTVIGLSPPCTMFSRMQDSNYTRVDFVILQERSQLAVKLWNVALWFAKYQIDHKRGFYLEHPEGSKAWSRPETVQLANIHGVEKVTFDECMAGLVSKEGKIPMLKRTTILTNMPGLTKHFGTLQCMGVHPHQRIHGCEGGMTRSEWSQRYPEEMCHLLADCVRTYAHSFKNNSSASGSTAINK